MLFVAFFSSVFAIASEAGSVPSGSRELLLLKLNLRRFPSKVECMRQVARADKHLDWIDARIPLFWRDEDALLEYRARVAACQQVWRMLQICQTAPLLPEDARRMRAIREAIGEENWRRGFVPPPVASCYLVTETSCAP